MREIKFRAWDKINNKIICFDFNNIYGYEGETQGVILPDEETVLTFNYDHNSNCQKGLNKDLCIMEYTGLKDRNGKEIYEGDIIIPRYNGFSAFAVEFKNGKFNISSFKVDSCEIIGNIYENKDLLE